jgi:hypothetical protein
VIVIFWLLCRNESSVVRAKLCWIDSSSANRFTEFAVRIPPTDPTAGLNAKDCRFLGRKDLAFRVDISLNFVSYKSTGEGFKEISSASTSSHFVCCPRPLKFQEHIRKLRLFIKTNSYTGMVGAYRLTEGVGSCISSCSSYLY